MFSKSTMGNFTAPRLEAPSRCHDTSGRYRSIRCCIVLKIRRVSLHTRTKLNTTPTSQKKLGWDMGMFNEWWIVWLPKNLADAEFLRFRKRQAEARSVVKTVGKSIREESREEEKLMEKDAFVFFKPRRTDFGTKRTSCLPRAWMGIGISVRSS